MAWRKRKSKFKAPCMVRFGTARNEKGHAQLCVWAECTYAGRVFGPVWSHTDQAVRRALAGLTHSHIQSNSIR